MHQLIRLGNTQCHNGYEVNICKELNPNGKIVLYIRKEKTLCKPLASYCCKFIAKKHDTGGRGTVALLFIRLRCVF